MPTTNRGRRPFGRARDVAAALYACRRLDASTVIEAMIERWIDPDGGAGHFRSA